MARRTPRQQDAERQPWLARAAALSVSAVLLLGLLAGAVSQCGSPSSSTEEPLAIEITVTPGAEEARLRQRLAENPEDVGAMIALADLLSNTGRGIEAVELYEQAIQLRPDDATLRVALGRTLLNYGYYADAEIQLQRAHELDASDPAALYFLGQVYESRSPPDTQQARAMYEQVVEIAPDSPYGRLARQRLDALQ